MSAELNHPEPAVIWGVQHNQGIRWCHSEAWARADMADMVAADARRQDTARGYVRLVRREIGPLEVVENPYEVAP